VAEEIWADPRLTAEQCRPTGLDLDVRAQRLTITWLDGVQSAFPLKFLRENCPCAACRTDREKRRDEPKTLLPVLTPAQAKASSAQGTGAQLVGNYALQIDWSDGHTSGIYDFRLLRTMHEVLEQRGGAR
jgi:DUF971 family protein